MFCDKLKELRKEKNLTQEQLADAIYVLRSLIAKYETGKVYPNKENLEKLVLFFNVKVDDLIDKEETALNVVEIKTYTKLANRIGLIVTACLTVVLGILIFIPMIQAIRYIYPIPPGAITPNRVIYYVSIYSGNMEVGNPVALIASLLMFINAVIALSTNFLKSKKLRLIFTIISYVLLALNIFLFFYSLMSCQTAVAAIE